MNQPRIATTQFTLLHKSFDIFISGCKQHSCVGCHNPELWEFENGEEYDSHYFLKIQDKVKEFPHLIDKIMIFGGEPLDSDLGELLFELSTLKLPIWIFTHYEINEVPHYVKNYCSFIKTGAYIPSLIVEDNIVFGIKLATSNQDIYRQGFDY